MRRTAVLIPLTALLLAGCSGGGDEEPTVLSVTTPAASATAAATTATTGTTPLPPPNETAPTATTTTTAAPAGPAAAYQGLALDWQRARGAFFTAISDGRQRPVAQQRSLAATYLRAQKAFATGLGGTAWPAGARGSVQALLAVNREQQANITGMATAGTSGGFTAFLGRYGVLAGRENAAVTAVAKSLG